MQNLNDYSFDKYGTISYKDKPSKTGIDKHGYRYLTYNGKPIKVHKMLYIIQGIDTTGKVVTHLNGKRLDNSLENLKLMKKGESNQHHFDLRQKSIEETKARYNRTWEQLRKCPIYQARQKQIHELRHQTNKEIIDQEIKDQSHIDKDFDQLLKITQVTPSESN